MIGVLIGAPLDQIRTEGDLEVIGRLLAVVESPDRGFPIVTP